MVAQMSKEATTANKMYKTWRDSVFGHDGQFGVGGQKSYLDTLIDTYVK
jgi:hypothetical protein